MISAIYFPFFCRLLGKSFSWPLFLGLSSICFETLRVRRNQVGRAAFRGCVHCINWSCNAPFDCVRSDAFMRVSVNLENRLFPNYNCMLLRWRRVQCTQSSGSHSKGETHHFLISQFTRVSEVSIDVPQAAECLLRPRVYDRLKALQFLGFVRSCNLLLRPTPGRALPLALIVDLQVLLVSNLLDAAMLVNCESSVKRQLPNLRLFQKIAATYFPYFSRRVP